MKKYLNKKTILLIISILVILAGMISIFISGFEKSIEYRAGTRIEVYISKGYDKQEIIDMFKESFNTSEIQFAEVEKLNQVAGIKITTEYSKEQLENYISKISEKYNIDKNSIEYYEISVPETKISTIIKTYILPVLLSTVLILIYVILKSFKDNKGIIKSLKILGILVIVLSIYFSLITLFRLPISIYTMPLALTIYIVTLLILVNKK